MTTDVTGALPDDLGTLLRLTPDVCAEFVAGSAQGPYAGRSRLLDRLRADPAARELFTRACRFEAPFGESWVHGAGDVSPYLSLELAQAALDE